MQCFCNFHALFPARKVTVKIHFVFRQSNIFEYSGGTSDEFGNRLHGDWSNCPYAFPSVVWGEDYSFKLYSLKYFDELLISWISLKALVRWTDNNRLAKHYLCYEWKSMWSTVSFCLDSWGLQSGIQINILLSNILILAISIVKYRWQYIAR